MRRIIHNTTALAACLSLMAPHLALAQPQLPDAASPQARMMAQAEPSAEGEVPPPAEAPPAEETPPADAPPAEAPPADSPETETPPPAEPTPVPVEEPEPEPEPAAEPEPMTEPEASGEPAPPPPAEQAPTEEAPVEAEAEAEPADAPSVEPAPAEPAAAEPAPPPAEAEPAAPEPEAEAAPAPPPAPEAAMPSEPAPEPRPETVETEAPAPRPQADAAPAADPQPQEAAPGNQPPVANPGRPAAQPPEQDPTADQAEQRPNARPQAAAEAPVGDDADALAEALRAQEQESQEQADQSEAPEAQADTEQAEANALRLATGSAQTDRAATLPGLANKLSQEVSGGLDASSLTCLDGSAFPCADGGRAMTPTGVVVETNDAGELRLAPAEAQMYRVGENGEMVQRAAEEDTRETEASREAAQASEPVSAAALDAEEGSGEVTEQQVTADDTRSSSEDFATNLRDALANTGQQQEAREDDGDDNDLRNALLLGLGALAVGSYLNNNRQVALSAPDRVVVTRADGSQEVIKDEVALLRQPGSTVQTENFDDGSSRTIVTREDGSRVVTIRDANLQVLRRTLVSADGTTTQLIDDTTDVQPVDIGNLPSPAPVQSDNTPLNEEQLREALQREANVDRRFTLSQIRNIPEVRALVAPVNIDAITFDTGSAAIRSDQAQQLQGLGRALQEQIDQNPQEIFMIEGHTDTVGSDAANLALSDRRAESVALALTEYFAVPPENLVTQGYGEQFLRVRAEGDIRDNRRASVRRITDLLAQ